MNGQSDIPLCVDLDGTLTPVDSLHESLLALARREPASWLRLPALLLRGRAAFKTGVLDALQARDPGYVEHYAGHLPLREDLLARLRQEHAAGRRVVLVTASDQRIAHAVAKRLDCFDEVLTGSGTHNLRGEAKRELLVSRYGERGYDYIGDSAVDLPVWSSARRAIVVGARPELLERVRRTAPQSETVDTPSSQRKAWRQALRPHQWIKNLLVFAPLLLAHRLQDPHAIGQALLAFAAFSLCASSVYIQNDLLDLAADRRHPRKRKRPFADGRLRAVQGVRAALLLLLLTAMLVWQMTPAFAAALTSYLLATIAYSLYLKTRALLDIIVLAGLYTLRIIAGGAATDIEPSFWLLAFAIFMFMSLGIVKRYTELPILKAGGTPLRGDRGYTAADAPLLLTLGCTSGLLAVLVLALYINSPASMVLYHQPQLLWMLCPLLLYWIGRVWLITTRGRMDDDPTVFAIRDRNSRVIALLGLLILWLAT